MIPKKIRCIHQSVFVFAEQLSCCGKHGYTDYKSSPCFIQEVTTPAPSNSSCLSVVPFSVVPVTCCKNSSFSHCNHGQESGRPDTLSQVHQQVGGKRGIKLTMKSYQSSKTSLCVQRFVWSESLQYV